MASIPTLTQRTVLPSDNALPVTDPSIIRGNVSGKMLQQTGQDISHSVDELVRAQARLQAQDDDREYSKLAIELSSTSRTLSYGDGTPDNPGYLNMQGENALNGFASAQAALNKKAAELTKMASNRQVKDRFAAYSGMEINQTLSRFSEHAANERIKANDATDQARRYNATLNATLDPGRLEEALATNQATITSQGLRNGDSSDKIAADLSKENSNTITDVIKSLIPTAPGVAAKLLSQHMGELDGINAAALKGAIHSQNMENLRNADYFEAHRAKELAKEQDKNLIPIIGQINAGQKTDAQLYDDLSHQTIDLQGFTYATNYKKALLSGELKSDPANLWTVDAGIRTGQITSYSQIQDLAKGGIITYQDAEKKNALLQDMLNNDPILSRADVKQGTEFIKNTLGPQPSLTGLTDEDQKQRYANALEEYQNKAKANPNQNMQNLYHMVVDSYRPKKVSLLALPKPKFAPIGYLDGTPEQIGDALKQAAIATMDSADMSQDEKDKEIKKITDYLALVDQMTSTPTVDTGAQQ